MFPRRVGSSPALLTLTLAIVFAATAQASPQRNIWDPVWMAPLSRPSIATSADPALSAGLFISLDPVTRRPTAPSAAQKRAAAAAAEAEDALLSAQAPMTVERLPQGGEVLRLNGHFQAFSIARRDANGRIVTECVEDPTAARKLLSQPSRVAAPPRAARAAAKRTESRWEAK